MRVYLLMWMLLLTFSKYQWISHSSGLLSRRYCCVCAHTQQYKTMPKHLMSRPFFVQGKSISQTQQLQKQNVLLCFLGVVWTLSVHLSQPVRQRKLFVVAMDAQVCRNNSFRRLRLRPRPPILHRRSLGVTTSILCQSTDSSNRRPETRSAAFGLYPIFVGVISVAC